MGVDASEPRVTAVTQATANRASRLPGPGPFVCSSRIVTDNGTALPCEEPQEKPSDTTSFSIAGRELAGPSRDWVYDFYPDRYAKESVPATMVLWGGFGMCCIPLQVIIAGKL